MVGEIIELLSTSAGGAPLWAWLLFISVVIGLVALDLGVFHKEEREIGIRESLWTSLGYVGAALAFGAWIWWEMGSDAGLKFLTGYFIEKSLSLDNIFVISLIFGYLSIPRPYQHRVLFWGIIGVLVMRAGLIGLGTALVHRFDWMLPVFGALLIVAAWRMLSGRQDEASVSEGRLLNQLHKRFYVTPELHGRAFLVRLPDRRDPTRTTLWITPLFLALVLVELADAVFALESVPAILAITQQPYLVYTSNVFAVLGLRAMYFALAAMVERFAYLKHTLALILGFVGGKIFYNQLVGHVHPSFSLAVILALLAGGVLASWLKDRQQRTKARVREA
jgi:tellurite resistance protein TerC